MELSILQKYKLYRHLELLSHTLNEECKRAAAFHSTQRKKESESFVNFYTEKALGYSFDAMAARMGIINLI